MKKHLRKSLSYFMTIVLILSVIIVAPIQASALSVGDVVNWMSSKNGTTINDGGTQCVAAFNSYLRLFGFSNPIGMYPVTGAKDIFDYDAPSGWQKIWGSGNYQVGDVVIWDGSIGHGWGHVGMVYSTDNGVKIFDQNWVTKNVCGIHDLNSTGAIRGVFRPPFGANPFPGEEDPSWNVPTNAYANSWLETYDDWGNVESGRHIDEGDYCYIEKVYKNGFVRVNYPLTGGGDRWAYAKASGFSLSYKNWYNGISAIDVGTDFYAYIINTHAWKHLTNDFDNVSMRSETGNAEQVWKFDRQGDGSYKITNAKDGKALDDNGAGTSDGANVQVYSSNDSSAQRWFIYGESGAYFLRAACGDLVLDINGGSTEDGTNVQMWTKNDSTAQKFQIWKLNKPGVTHVNCSVGTSFTPTVFSWNATSDTTEYDVKIWKGTVWEGDAYKILWSETGTSVSVDLPEGYYEAYVDSRNKYSISMSDNVVSFNVSHGTPVFLGKSFTANIINAKGNLCIGATSDGNVNLQSKSGDDSQKWLFEQQEDNSYRITNIKYQKCMDVYNYETANGTNIQLWEPNDTDAQFFYVRMNDHGYCLIPKCNMGGALDIKGNVLENGTNIQEWTYHGENAQTFCIEYLSVVPSETQEYNGHRYEYFDLITTWNQAYRVCEQKGGHLVTIESKAENDFVQSMAAKHEANCWLGSTDFAGEGNWYWITGEEFNYTNWYDGEPNNDGGKEHYMAMYTSSGHWNDFTIFGESHKNTGFICEYGTSTVINASDYSPSKTFEYNGIKYEVYTDSVDWQTANQICKSKKGRLALIENEDENNAIKEAIADSNVGVFWINATDIYSKGSWTSDSKEPLSYTCWENGEPNNSDHTETYAVIKKSGNWNDLFSFYGYFGNVGFICKYDRVTPGDINSDGKVNMKDLVLLQQYLNNWDVTIDERAANVNGDNKINMKDLVLLQQFLNNWDVELV